MKCLICDEQLPFLSSEDIQTVAATMNHYVGEHSMADVVMALVMQTTAREEAIHAN